MRRGTMGEEIPNLDTGWGLIFRLNDLFRDIDRIACLGRYDEWNIKIDRIWANLTFEKEMLPIKNEDGEIVELKYNEEDIKEKEYLDNKIRIAKSELRSNYERCKRLERNHLGDKEYIKAKNNLYQAMMNKDVWIRKLMHKYKMYITTKKHNPAGAMFNK